MKGQHPGQRRKNQAENTADKGQHHTAQQCPPPGAQFFAVHQGVPKAEQQKYRGRQFVDDKPGKGYQKGEYKADNEQPGEQFFS